MKDRPHHHLILAVVYVHCKETFAQAAIPRAFVTKVCFARVLEKFCDCLRADLTWVCLVTGFCGCVARTCMRSILVIGKISVRQITAHYPTGYLGAPVGLPKFV